ncbi:putative wsc domain protein [Diplogelasinospora grovesii]|uniref:Wsc domain protein n=1 Tax=Diplogelasinospora grovesii TaxID=303347 RepID=A0AAN6RZU5_9PEZI|nr:putative wsc domain protein [Diplogelasinospora grovesii]
MKSIVTAAAALLAATHVLAATGTGTNTAPSSTSTGVEEPSTAPVLNQITTQGCFSSQGELVLNGTLQFNTKGSCGTDTCLKLGYPVAATSGGNQCYCGKKYPPKDTLVDDKNCNVGCTGFDLQACGGINYWTVYNTGLQLAVAFSSDDASASASGGSATSTTGPTAAVTLPGSTVVVTATDAASTQGPSSGGTNVAGIAAGVVVSIVVVAAAVGGIFFYLRRKRNQEIEEEHRRNAAVNSFISGKPPSSSGGMSISDARLDPVMAQRRMSDGSIADNQDYSRRILRVCDCC